MAPERLPPPWEVHTHPESFSVRDANGFPIAYVYFQVGAPLVGTGGDRLSRDQARRVAAGIARLPELLGK